MREHNYYVYILAKKRNSTFYVGVTNNLIRRVYEHKEGLAAGFTKKYGIKLLVYYECHTDIREAIRREKLIKRWKRSFKMQAIERMNPDWDDLYYELTQQPDPAMRCAYAG
jgi:putative endonuclease